MRLVGPWPSLCALFIGVAVHAQDVPTNAGIYTQLGLECLAAVPGRADSLMIIPPERLPFVTSALVQHWQKDGRTVFAGDSARTGTLSWEVLETAVHYERLSRRRIQRAISLELHYSWVAETGQIVAHNGCARSYSDAIARSDIRQLESPAYPETIGVTPAQHWPRRYLEPIVLASASAVAAFLFFNLRSGRADS